jgi:hypothetical protein
MRTGDIVEFNHTIIIDDLYKEAIKTNVRSKGEIKEFDNENVLILSQQFGILYKSKKDLIN